MKVAPGTNQKLVDDIVDGDVFCKNKSPYNFTRFSISVSPKCAVSTVKTIMKLTGPINSTRTEAVPAFFVFGDSIDAGFTYNLSNPGVYKGDINGDEFKSGNYTITADFYKSSTTTAVNKIGDLTAKFEVKTCP